MSNFFKKQSNSVDLNVNKDLLNELKKVAKGLGLKNLTITSGRRNSQKTEEEYQKTLRQFDLEKYKGKPYYNLIEKVLKRIDKNGNVVYPKGNWVGFKKDLSKKIKNKDLVEEIFNKISKARWEFGGYESPHLRGAKVDTSRRALGDETYEKLKKALEESGKFHIMDEEGKGVLDIQLKEGVINKNKTMSFKDAFEQARSQNKKEFMWKGELKNTRRKDETKEEWLEDLSRNKDSSMSRNPQSIEDRSKLNVEQPLEFLQPEKMYTPKENEKELNYSEEDFSKALSTPSNDTLELTEEPEVEPSEDDFIKMLEPYANMKTEEMLRAEKAKKFEDMIREFANRPIEETPQQEMNNKNMFKNGGRKYSEAGQGVPMNDERLAGYEEEDLENEELSEPSEDMGLSSFQKEIKKIAEGENSSDVTPKRQSLQDIYKEYKTLQDQANQDIEKSQRIDDYSRLASTMAQFLPEQVNLKPTNFARRRELDRSRQLRDVARKANLMDFGKTAKSSDPNSNESKIAREYASRILKEKGLSLKDVFGETSEENLTSEMITKMLPQYLKSTEKDDKEKSLSFKEKEGIKLDTETKKQIRQENRKFKKDAIKVKRKAKGKLENIQKAIGLLEKMDKKYPFDTGRLDQYLAQFSDDGQELRLLLEKLGLETMTTMFEGLSRAVDSERDREKFDATQPDMAKNASVNLKYLKDLERYVSNSIKNTENEISNINDVGDFKKSMEEVRKERIPERDIKQSSRVKPSEHPQMSGAEEWLAKNPNHPKAEAVRKRIGK